MHLILYIRRLGVESNFTGNFLILRESKQINVCDSLDFETSRQGCDFCGIYRALLILLQDIATWRVAGHLWGEHCVTSFVDGIFAVLRNSKCQLQRNIHLVICSVLKDPQSFI